MTRKARPLIDFNARPSANMNFFFDVFMKMDSEPRNVWFKRVTSVAAYKLNRRFPLGVTTGEQAGGLTNWTLYESSVGEPPFRAVEEDKTINGFWWRMFNHVWRAHRDRCLTEGRGEGKEVSGVSDDARIADSIVHLVQPQSGFRSAEDAVVFADKFNRAKKRLDRSRRPGTGAARIRTHGLMLLAKGYNSAEVAELCDVSEESVRKEFVRMRDMTRPIFLGDDDGEADADA